MNIKIILEDKNWSKHISRFEQSKIKAKTILLNEGQVSRRIFFIENGCLRTWINYKGKDLTTQFFFEGSMVSSIESFKTKQPSLYTIESIEKCVIYSISQEDFQSIIDSTPTIKKEIEEYLFGRLIHCQQLFLSHLKNTPQERYEALLEQNPEIIKRIPQHYIASYLGITTVSLSRIRNRL